MLKIAHTFLISLMAISISSCTTTPELTGTNNDGIIKKPNSPLENSKVISKPLVEHQANKPSVASQTTSPSMNGQDIPITPQPSPQQPILKTFQFGSQAILNCCWTQAQLAGSPRDKKVQGPIKKPFRGPPKKRIPDKLNPPLERNLRYSISRVIPDKNKKIVALTFDLCERAKERTGYYPCKLFKKTWHQSNLLCWR